MIIVRLSSDAREDLDEGFWFYEHQEPGVGEYFASSLRADIEGLKVTAGIHRRAYHGYHRLLSRAFPYANYCTLDGHEAIVRAVADCRRVPEWIQRRLGD